MPSWIGKGWFKLFTGYCFSFKLRCNVRSPSLQLMNGAWLSPFTYVEACLTCSDGSPDFSCDCMQNKASFEQSKSDPWWITFCAACKFTTCLPQAPEPGMLLKGAGNFVDASVVPATVDHFVVSLHCQSNTLPNSCWSRVRRRVTQKPRGNGG